ncbi:MAG: hypothetical protein ACE5KZ_04505 [Candidatus Scalinduaceae bacterium]
MSVKKLIQNHKNSIIHIPFRVLYGSRYLLFLINIILICFVVILCAISISLYPFTPAENISETPDVIDNLNVDVVSKDINSIYAISSEERLQGEGDYGIVSTRNIFSPERKEWVTKIIKPQTIKVNKKQIPEKRTLSRKTRKFILYGVIIAGDVKKALINNILSGGSKKRTMYVEEGDEIEGYRVASIETDHIKLYWEGEEIVVKLYTTGGEVSRQPEGMEMFNMNQRNEIFQNLPMSEDVDENFRKGAGPFTEMLDKSPPKQLPIDQKK